MTMASAVGKSAPDRGATERFLAQVVRGEVFPYTEFPVAKRTSGIRVLHAPVPELAAKQLEILGRLQRTAVTDPAAFAYRAGYSVVDCARVHLRAHTVVRLDVANFFGSILERHVYSALQEVDDAPWSNYTTTRLTTVSPPGSPAWRNRGTGELVKDGSVERSDRYMHNREGFLPQGAPTSGMLSNLVMRKVDEALRAYAEHEGLRYTRYSDDLYFSSRTFVAHRQVDALVRKVRQSLAELGLRLNDRKTWVARPGHRRSVLGILVDGPTPRLSRDYKRKVTVHLRGAAAFGVADHASFRGFSAAEQLDAHVTGLLSFAHQVEPAWAAERLATWKRLRSLGTSHGTEALADPAHQLSGAAEAKASIDALVAGAHRYRGSQAYVELLKFVGTFKRYSPYNAMLINLQKPGARYALTEPRWRTEYGRVLEPGAQPLVILQPGGPFMVVYDVGDTEALRGAHPLPPEITNPVAVQSRISDPELKQRWDWTLNNLAPLGVRLTLVSHANSSCGSTYPARRSGTVTRLSATGKTRPEEFSLLFEIEVNTHLALVDKYATLVHELAHLFCGHAGPSPVASWPDRRDGSKARNEVEAESVAHMVLGRLDPDVTMGDYILGHLDKDGDMPEVALNVMFKVAGDIIELGSGRIATNKLRKELGR